MESIGNATASLEEALQGQETFSSVALSSLARLVKTEGLTLDETTIASHEGPDTHSGPVNSNTSSSVQIHQVSENRTSSLNKESCDGGRSVLAPRRFEKIPEASQAAEWCLRCIKLLAVKTDVQCTRSHGYKACDYCTATKHCCKAVPIYLRASAAQV